MTHLTGGGSSAPSASAHSGCERFRGSDPLVTGTSRRDLASKLGFSDDQGTIPDARWVRALTFEKVLQQQPLTTRFVTTALGAAGFDRPSAVKPGNPVKRSGTAADGAARTAEALQDAHDRAVNDGVATLVHTLTVPFPNVPGDSYPVRPDFAIVAPSAEGKSALLMGDAKDYERVRSRIDDGRLLKGFLQVALGAEAAARWDALPSGMKVSRFGVLAVPRNAFLQPTPVVEELRDYRREVSDRLAERLDVLQTATSVDDLASHVAHLEATFDPRACASCTLFRFCRNELRQSETPADLLIEIGVPRGSREAVLPVVEGGALAGDVSKSTLAAVQATVTGLPERTGQRRIDSAGQPGTINVVLATADGGSLGVHGISVRRFALDGELDWETTTFADPLSSATRLLVMRILGEQLEAAMADMASVNPEAPSPIHLVAPDTATADLMVSIADNLAGVELSRLRWERDVEQGRPALTFDGEPAVIPAAITGDERTAVSFLVETDRNRAITLRSAVIDARAALARSFVAGGPAFNSLRLDYLLRWTEATTAVDHRAIGDEIENETRTPGARLATSTSNRIFAAQGRAGKARPEYDQLVRDELRYKQDVLDRTIAVLASLPDSAVREVHRAIEGDAQKVWRRRRALEASDLVKFERVYAYWRNKQVTQIDDDVACAVRLGVLANPQQAFDLAFDPGNRDLVAAQVASLDPVTVTVNSRRVADGDSFVVLHHNDTVLVEEPPVAVTTQPKVTGIPAITLHATDQPKTYEVTVAAGSLSLALGDQLALARGGFIGLYKNKKSFSISRPGTDTSAAPHSGCVPTSYADDPDAHKWCCRPHQTAEAEWSDTLAERRARGELNPQVWPPALDEDGFEVTGVGQPTADTVDVDVDSIPADLSLTDID